MDGTLYVVATGRICPSQLVISVSVSPELFPSAISLRVGQETIASDHMPLVLQLTFRQIWNTHMNSGRFRLGARDQSRLASFLCTHRSSLLQQIEASSSVDAMGSLISECAEQQLVWLPPSRPRRRLARQPWYSQACVAAYRCYRAAWRAHKRSPMDTDLAQLARNKRNRYYAVLRCARREFDRSYGDSMQALFSADSRAFHRALFPREHRASDGVDVAVWEQYFGAFFTGRVLAGDDPEPRVCVREDCLSHPSLLVPFTEFEVAAALGRLKRRTCGGADAWTVSFFRGEGLAEAWRPLLVAMFNMCLRERRVPVAWLLGVIRPIWKRRGSKDDPSRYRPIMLCTIWYKLFMYLLMERLGHLLDPIRHASQAGFRQGCETTTWIFATWGLLYRARRSGALLILLSLDLEKAYDSVSHSRLWLHFRRLGLAGMFFDLLKFMYEHSTALVRGTKGCTVPFGLGRGVRQGCPFSPLLYTLYHDNLARLLEGASIGHVVLGLAIIVALIFADDTLVPCSSVDDVSSVGSMLGQFERDWGVKSNLEKTEAMVVNARGLTTVSLNGIDVELQSTMKYLGVLFKDGPGNVNVFSDHIDDTLQKGQAAVGRLLARSGDLGLRDPKTLLALFRMYVLGKVQYAAPVWCFFLTRAHKDAFNGLQVRFLKRVLRLPVRALRNVVYLEMGALPILFYFNKNAVRFWNRLMTLPVDHPARQLILWLQSETTESRRSWWVLFRDMVRRFDPGFDGSGAVDLSVWTRAYKADIVARLRSGHPRLVAFYNVFKTTFGYTAALSSFEDVGLRTVWVRFRARLHGLEIDVADLSNRDVPLHERFCPFCLSRGVRTAENERHFLYFCPLYDGMRGGSVVAESRGSLRRLFGLPGQYRVAVYIRRALDVRSEWMASRS